MFKPTRIFKNWKRIAGQAAARADALESEKRAVEHRCDHLRTERAKMLKERDELKADVARINRRRDELAAERDAYAERLDQIAACETDKANGTVRRMARIARGES